MQRAGGILSAALLTNPTVTKYCSSLPAIDLDSGQHGLEFHLLTLGLWKLVMERCWRRVVLFSWNP